MKFLIINGPNINMLGIREPSIYGKADYSALLSLIDETCIKEGIEYEHFQSNHEGDIIDKIQEAYGNTDGIVINPGGYTHTSVAILDALKSVSIPVAEVHISDVDSRESFRTFSYVSLAASVTVKGHGIAGYAEAICELKKLIK